MRWPLDDADLAFATESLGDVPTSYELMDLLLCLLCHREPAVRECAARAAKSHRERDPRLDIALADMARNDASMAVREAARRAFF